MKPYIKYVALIFSALLLVKNSFGKSPDTTSCLEFSGKILKIKTTASNEYTVALMTGSTVIETKTVKGNNSFKFNLKKNLWYTVRISKAGYVPRTVSVDTRLNPDQEGYYKFNFDTELIEKADAVKLNGQALSMPIAHIYFDSKKHWFANNINYTNIIKKNIYNRHVQLNK